MESSKSYDTLIINDYISNLLKIFIMILCCCIQGLNTGCPHLCECKWKSGKESVLCLNANLSSIPLNLDAGTQVLDLTSNNIVTVTHDEFSKAGLINLQKIYIAKCRLKTLDRYAFRHLINLVELDLSYNVLNTVPSHTFDSIPELRELRLNGNPIKVIENDAFVHVPQLTRLELSNCRITRIDARGFAGLEASLKWLHLDSNNLSEIHSNTLISLQNLHGLELANNPWNCSCTLRPLREWMLRHNVPYGVPPICQAPARLAGKSWDRLELDEFACAPAIEAYIPKTHGIEGRNVTMSCKIDGVPEPNVRWLLKNKVIANLSSVPYNIGKKLYIVHLQNQASNLTILTADMQDAGEYVCTAENKAGRAEATVTLAVSRRQTDESVPTRLIIVCVISAIILTMIAFVVVVCICGVRKRQQARSLTYDDQRRDENYEKIEMSNKMINSRNSAGVNNSNGLVLTGSHNVSNETVSTIRRRGDYRGLPTAETDLDADEEDDSRYGDNAENVHGSSGTTNREKQWQNYSNENAGSIKMAQLNVSQWNDELNGVETDLHIPRRPTGLTDIYSNRDDCKKIRRSTSGTFNQYSRGNPSGSFKSQSLETQLQNQTTSSSRRMSGVSGEALPQMLHPYIMRKQVLENSGGSLYTTSAENEMPDQTDRSYPDLLEMPEEPTNSRALSDRGDVGVTTTKNDVTSSNDDVNSPASMASYSRKPIENRYYSLPRNRTGGRNLYVGRNARCYNSTDSEVPLLTDSRYSSSGGEDNYDNCDSLNRRLSTDDTVSPYTNRYPQRSSSYLNLSRAPHSLPTSPLLTEDTASVSSTSHFDNSATPLLDISRLESKNTYLTPSYQPHISSNTNTYDYHATQLERFLEEYRNLQEQLNKMKETCEDIRDRSTTTPAAVTTTSTKEFLDPLLYNGSSSSDNGDICQLKFILKNKGVTPSMVSGILSPVSNTIPDAPSPLTLTPGDCPEDPSSSTYWLSRNSLLKHFNGGSTVNNYKFQS